jgi:hypothetical protein
MIQQQKRLLVTLVLLTALSFLVASCSLFGKKKETKSDNSPEGKTVRIDNLEPVKGVNPPNSANPSSSPPPKNPSASPVPSSPQPAPPGPPQIASLPPRSAFSPSLPSFEAGFKKKVVVLDFENKTTYQDEKIGDTVTKKLSDRLEATQRLIIMDRTVVEDRLKKQGIQTEKPASPEVMKAAYTSLGVQSFLAGTVADVSLLASKTSESSDEEVSFATAKVEIQLMDASTGNLLKTFVGRSPIFGTKETGENSRGKAVMKAIDASLDDVFDGILRHLDLLDWTTTIAKVDGDNFYINAGRMSGLRIGDTLEVFEPGKEVIHPTTNLSLGWTTGKSKGYIRVTELFGVDAAGGKVIQGQGFSVDDVVKPSAR